MRAKYLVPLAIGGLSAGYFLWPGIHDRESKLEKIAQKTEVFRPGARQWEKKQKKERVKKEVLPLSSYSLPSICEALEKGMEKGDFSKYYGLLDCVKTEPDSRSDPSRLDAFLDNDLDKLLSIYLDERKFGESAAIMWRLGIYPQEAIEKTYQKFLDLEYDQQLRNEFSKSSLDKELSELWFYLSSDLFDKCQEGQAPFEGYDKRLLSKFMEMIKENRFYATPQRISNLLANSKKGNDLEKALEEPGSNALSGLIANLDEISRVLEKNPSYELLEQGARVHEYLENVYPNLFNAKEYVNRHIEACSQAESSREDSNPFVEGNYDRLKKYL